MGQRNVVLKKKVMLSDVSQLADRLGWTADRKYNDRAERYETGEHAWRRARRERVVFAQDEALEQDYFVIDSPNPVELVGVILESFSSLADSEILVALRTAESSDELVRAFNLVAARSFESYDAEISAAIERGVQSQEVLVRLAALLAASRLRWQRLRQVVEVASERDPDASMRNVAYNFLNLTSWDRD